jgi:hypothetical protein
MPFPSSRETEHRHQTLCRKSNDLNLLPHSCVANSISYTASKESEGHWARCASRIQRCAIKWMEDRWNFGICAQKAHPACFQRMNSWDGNLSDLPSCLDLGLRQSASNLYRYWIGRLQIPKRPRNITRSLSQGIGQRCHRRLRHGD